MRPGPSDRAAAIFLALSQAPPDDHARLLDAQCGGDDDVRREVERLLGELNVPDRFLEPGEPIPTAEERISHSAGALIGDFIVIRQIGAGGTGVVYLAHQQHPARIVALKVLRHEFVASTVQRRFEIEAELLGHLHHPGIAQIYAAHPGDSSTPPYIAMELVNGPPLTEYADSRRMSIRERVELVAHVCDAVQHAHQRGIIHRDLKPGNILVNEDGQPKILDFGVARTVGAQVSLTTIETETGQLVGTLAYMSPEQIEAAPQSIDTRTDIHALGVILFRLLAGRLPFGHDNPPLPELARRIVREEPPRLGTFDPRLRGDLEVIASRALAKEKERRYPSAADLATDLRRYLGGEPIAASHDSAWYVVRRRLRRYRQALALSAVVGLALAGLAFYASVQRARVDRVNIQVEKELARSTIERGRLLSVTGNLPVAEELVWRELFKAPDSRHAQWALWDIYSREPSLWSTAAHEGGTLSVRFSPDNRYLLTAGQFDGLVRLLEAESGRVVRNLGTASYGGTRRALFTPDGSSIVAGSKDGTLRVWDVRTGELRREIPHAIRSLDDLAIAGGGAYAVTVGGGTLQVWSLSTGARVADLSALAAAAVVAADPAGTLVVAGSNDGTVTAMDFTTGRRLWQTRAHRGQAISLAIAPSRRLVASGGTDSFIYLWNGSTGALERTIATENGSVRNMNFDRSGAKIAAAGQWRTKLWDLDDSTRAPLSFGGAQGMTDVDITPDARFLANCHGASGLVRLWDASADARVDHWGGHSSMVTGLIVAGGASFASSAVDGTVSLWQSGQTSPRFSLKPGARVSGLAIDDTKRWIVSVGYPGTAAVWDARDGRNAATISAAGSSRAALFVDGNRRLVIGDGDGTLEFWDWSDGAARNQRRVAAPAEGEVLALAAHGSRLFIAHRETIIVIRDVATGAEIRRMRPAASPFSLAVSPDGRMLASGLWPGLVDLWDVETGRRIDSLKGPTALVHGLDFNADGSLLALSSRDGSTRLWDVAAKEWLATVASRKVGAERVRFLPDGRRLAIGYEDGEVEIRDLDHFFRYVAGHAEYQLRTLRAAGEWFPRSGDVLEWSGRILSAPRN